MDGCFDIRRTRVGSYLSLQDLLLPRLLSPYRIRAASLD